MANKIIIGLVGEIASGKDTVAEYLKQKYDSETISFSKPLRDILDRLFLPQNRENMANLGFDLRTRFGQDLLAKAIAEEIKVSDKNMMCLPNVRLESDITYLKEMPGFFLIAVSTEPKIRYERLIHRGQNPDDKTKTWEQFLKDSKLSTEIHIQDLMGKAKFNLDNNGSLVDLYAQIDELMGRLTI